MDEEKYIVRGDPVDPKYSTIAHKSLGEFYLEKFKELGDTIVFVSIKMTNFIQNSCNFS